MSRYVLALLFAFSVMPVAAEQMPGPDADRGEVLYAAQCGTCHNSSVHWRDKTLAKDWPALRSWVRHWERFNELKWSEDDITSVARYLNRLYYHYPENVPRQGKADGGRTSSMQGTVR
ncbi:MAG TPA: cytochrome c [Gallionellaceae bacterium]